MAEDNTYLAIYNSKKFEARENIDQKKSLKTRQTANSFTCPNRIVIHT